MLTGDTVMGQLAVQIGGSMRVLLAAPLSVGVMSADSGSGLARYLIVS
jgi:hypothetical protein